MNFLEIVKKANIFSGLQGEVDSVTSATGIQKTLVECVSAAYLDIQLHRESWAWMQKYTSSFQWGEASVSQINSGVNKYLSVYDTGGNELEFIDYFTWTLRAVPVAIPEPKSFTIIPESNAIVINPVTQIVTVNYIATLDPETLTTDVQVPKMPSRYHYTIVYKAAMDMGAMLGNPEIQASNAAKYDISMGALLGNQNLPVSIRQRPLV